jgi:hypothetical protein
LLAVLMFLDEQRRAERDQRERRETPTAPTAKSVVGSEPETGATCSSG